MTATPTPADQRSATRVVFPEPRRVELEEVIVDLRELGPHEVVVQARRSVISPGTELAHYRGDSLVGLRPPAQRPHQPFHPGYAMAGTVLAAGLDSGFAVGTSVLSHTPHQSVVRFDPRQHVCLPLPAGIGLDIAPFARLGQIGGISLQLTAARPGDTVAVIGLGPVGNLVAQLAQASGYRVVSVERSPGRRDARPLHRAQHGRRTGGSRRRRRARRRQPRAGVLRQPARGPARHGDLRSPR